MSKIVAALREAIDIFENRGLEYAVMGGLAVRTHGIPRPTWDIDFTLAIDRDHLDIFHGEVVNTRDVITFQGKSVEELNTAFRDSIEHCLAFCEKRDEEPGKPYAGR